MKLEEIIAAGQAGRAFRRAQWPQALTWTIAIDEESGSEFFRQHVVGIRVMSAAASPADITAQDWEFVQQ